MDWMSQKKKKGVKKTRKRKRRRGKRRRILQINKGLCHVIGCTSSPKVENFNSPRAPKNQLASSGSHKLPGLRRLLPALGHLLDSSSIAILIWWALRRSKVSKTIIIDWIFFFKGLIIQKSLASTSSVFFGLNRLMSFAVIWIFWNFLIVSCPKSMKNFKNSFFFYQIFLIDAKLHQASHVRPGT